MADNFDMKQFLVENKLGAYSKLREDIEEAKKEVSKEDKIQVIKEWIWYTCDEGQAKDDINKYNKMVDMYFASKDDVTKGDFKNIWNKVIEKWGVGDVGADSEGFYDAWKDIQTGTLVNPGQTYEGKKEVSKEDMGHDIEDAEAMKQMDFLAEYEVIYVYGEDGKCYRKDDEGNYDQVDRSYCQRYAGSGVREEKEEEGYMGTQYDSSEDMAVDMLKKGITEKETEEAFGGVNERLAPHVFSRMAGLSSYKAQMAMIKAAEVMMRELVDEGFEVEEIREYFNQLIANDI